MRGVKKYKQYSLSFEDFANECLRNMGFIDGNGKVKKGKILSKFMSRLIIDFYGVNHPKESSEIKEKLLLFDLVERQEQRDKLERDIQFIAHQIRKLKDSRNIQKE